MIRIQPLFGEASRYEDFARTEQLHFEVLELSMPGNPAFDREKATAWYRDCGLSASLHGNFIDVNPASGDARVQALSKKLIAESCETAKNIGVSDIVFHCACFPFLRGGYLDHWAGVTADYFDALADEWDMNLYLENSYDLDATPLKTVMQLVQTPRVRVCLDLGHANYSRLPIEGWFGELGEHIAYLHLSDNMGLFDDHLPLGDGTVDWSYVSTLAKPLGDIPMTLEVGDMNGIRKSLAYLRERQLFDLLMI